MQGYVAACLKALHRLGSVQLYVIHLDFEDLPFQEELLLGIPNERLMARQANAGIPQMVAAQKPDAVILSGWFYSPYRELVYCSDLRGCKFVLGMDTPWIGSWRQRLNRIRLREFMRRIDRVLVAGVKSKEFARRIGVPPEKILTGLYGFDFTGFLENGGTRLDSSPEWPQSFLFAGRYAPEKGLELLLEAYRRYRLTVDVPWPLDCCGTGPESIRLKGPEGVHDLGYVQPSGLPALFAQHGVFVMPSLKEPWGVAIAEAAATGLPVICSDACGAALDLVREYYNGVTVPAGSPSALAESMTWMHQNHQRLRTLGLRGRDLARAYSAEAWAERLHACLTQELSGVKKA